MEQIKRVNIGSLVRTVSGNVGIITGSDKERVYFTTPDGQEHSVFRGAAFKCSRKEYDAAVAKYQEQEESRRALAAALEANEQEMADEDDYALDVEIVEDEEVEDEEYYDQFEEGDEYADAEGPLPEDEDDEGEEDKTRSIVGRRYKSRYINTRSSNGSSSKICGDGVSKLLSGESIECCAELVAGYTGDDPQELLARYAHLNPGQQRMNIGNRLRTWARKNCPELAEKPEGEE